MNIVSCLADMLLKAAFTPVTACLVATYYYVGFCYIMLRRYPDAIRTFVSILNTILRMRQYHTRSYQYDQVRSMLFGLHTICSKYSLDQQNRRQNVRPLCDL